MASSNLKMIVIFATGIGPCALPAFAQTGVADYHGHDPAGLAVLNAAPS